MESAPGYQEPWETATWCGSTQVGQSQCHRVGVAACSPAQTLGEGAHQSATGSVADSAGNTASATVSGINIDKTAPVVTYTGNAGTYSVDQKVVIRCTATDSLSGLASSDCADIVGPAYDLELGVNTFTATAIDKAGNETTPPLGMRRPARTFSAPT